MSFGKSRARMFSGEHPTVTFQDVAGVEESKQELAEVVEFLKEPQKFIQLGRTHPEGCFACRALRVQVKHFWQKQFPVKRAFRSSPFPVLNLWKCSWVWVPAVYVIFLIRPNGILPVSSL